MLYISHHCPSLHVPNTLTTICTMYIFQTNPCHVLPQHMPLHVPRSHLLNQTTATSRVTLTYVNVTAQVHALHNYYFTYLWYTVLPLNTYHCMPVHVPTTAWQCMCHMLNKLISRHISTWAVYSEQWTVNSFDLLYVRMYNHQVYNHHGTFKIALFADQGLL